MYHAKSLGTDEAWEIYDKLVETYFRAKALKYTLDSLSPQLKVLINLELKQKEHEEKLVEHSQKIKCIENEIIKFNKIRNVLKGIDSDNWRQETNSMINAIVLSGNYEGDYRDLRHEIYDELTRARNRARELGESETSVQHINKLDMIARDTRLKEIYCAIVKEFYVKYV